MTPFSSDFTMPTSHTEDSPSSADLAVPELRVGKKLKAARKAHRMSLRDLAERVGCSESMLSKIENERALPSLPMLHKIAAELGTSIGRMFSESQPEDQYLFRKGQRPLLNLDAIGRDGARGIHLEGVAINGELLYSSIHIVDPGGDSGGFISHVGEELAYVLEGEVEINLSGRIYQLSEGDSLFFPSELPHSYRNPGMQVARVLWINTPPTF